MVNPEEPAAKLQEYEMLGLQLNRNAEACWKRRQNEPGYEYEQFLQELQSWHRNYWEAELRKPASNEAYFQRIREQKQQVDRKFAELIKDLDRLVETASSQIGPSGPLEVRLYDPIYVSTLNGVRQQLQRMRAFTKGSSHKKKPRDDHYRALVSLAAVMVEGEFMMQANTTDKVGVSPGMDLVAEIVKTVSGRERESTVLTLRKIRQKKGQTFSAD